MDALRAAGSLPMWRGSVRAPTMARVAEAAILPTTVGMLWFAAVAQGAFYRTQASLFAAGLVALALASSSTATGLAPFLSGFALLASGLVASGLVVTWGPNAPLAIAALCSGAAIVPVVAHAIGRGERARLLEAVSWIGAGTAAVGIAGVVLHRAPWAIRAQGLWRTSSTLTYANAAGSLFLLALGASVLALLERPTAARRLGAFLTLCGLATTLSRGAAVSGVVALVVLASLGRFGLLSVLVRPGVGALCAFAGIVPSIVSDQPRPVLAVVALCVGGAVAGSARLGAPRRPLRRVILAVVAALGITVAIAGAGRVVEQRALPASETRLSTWRNTWSVALHHPVFGTGPGTFSTLEQDHEGRISVTRYAHNEYLQAFSETGAVGLATIAGAIAIFGVWAWRRRRDDGGYWAIACASCAGFAAHSALDFVWRMPLLVALVFMWLAVAATPATADRGKE